MITCKEAIVGGVVPEEPSCSVLINQAKPNLLDADVVCPVTKGKPCVKGYTNVTVQKTPVKVVYGRISRDGVMKSPRVSE